MRGHAAWLTVRFKPTPPALSESIITVVDESVLKACTAATRFCKLMLPSMRLYLISALSSAIPVRSIIAVPVEKHQQQLTTRSSSEPLVYTYIG